MGDIKFCRMSVMKSTYPSLISESENLQYPQEIMVPSLIMCTLTKETVHPSMCQALIIKKTRHAIISEWKIQIVFVCTVIQITLKI